MSEMLAENNVQVREKFICDTDMKAEWCLNKIRKIRAEQQRETEELERQMQFYVDQKAMIDHNADEDVAFFEGILRGYFNNRVDAGFTKETKKQVTYKLPSGTLKVKHLEPKYDYKTGAKDAITFLKENKMEQYVKVKEELDWDDLKKLTKVVDGAVVLKETGEIVPGITATARDDEFSVEVN